MWRGIWATARGCAKASGESTPRWRPPAWRLQHPLDAPPADPQSPAVRCDGRKTRKDGIAFQHGGMEGGEGQLGWLLLACGGLRRAGCCLLLLAPAGRAICGRQFNLISAPPCGREGWSVVRWKRMGRSSVCRNSRNGACPCIFSVQPRSHWEASNQQVSVSGVLWGMKPQRARRCITALPVPGWQ